MTSSNFVVPFSALPSSANSSGDSFFSSSSSSSNFVVFGSSNCQQTAAPSSSSSTSASPVLPEWSSQKQPEQPQFVVFELPPALTASTRSRAEGAVSLPQRGPFFFKAASADTSTRGLVSAAPFRPMGFQQMPFHVKAKSDGIDKRRENDASNLVANEEPEKLSFALFQLEGEKKRILVKEEREEEEKKEENEKEVVSQNELLKKEVGESKEEEERENEAAAVSSPPLTVPPFEVKGGRQLRKAVDGRRRLLFDNPLFRRLPNWHFFGDDRRLTPIPRTIPIITVPVERTLLSVAPSVSWIRQLLLLGLLDVKGILAAERAALSCLPLEEAMHEKEEEEEEFVSEGTEEMIRAEETEKTEEEEVSNGNGGYSSSSASLLPPFYWPSSESEEADVEDEDECDERETLPPDGGGCPSSSSGVESMYSGEAETVTSPPTPSTNGANTPTQKTMTPCADSALKTSSSVSLDDDWEEKLPLKEVEDEEIEVEEEEEEMDEGKREETSAASSSVPNSANSSTPNTPPTFDRRVVRMSRATRNAVLRLSISRRFCGDEEEELEVENAEEEEEEEEEEGEDKKEKEEYDEDCDGKRNAANCVADEQMFLRAATVNNAATAQMQPQLPPPPLQQQNQFYHSFKVPISPGGISRMDVLSERIYDFHQNTEQTQTQLNRKLMLRDQLYYAISPIFPLCGLYIVGSSLNGFGTSHSDLDLCLMITNRDIDQRNDALVVLSTVMRTLKTAVLVVDQQLIPAKVPILRIKCGGAYSDIVVDLNVNNSVAIRNTHLLCYYSAFDWRVRLIVMVVKEWAKRRGINNASRSSFTSYSLVLMVIHYLQCGANPPVLPSLQMLYPKRFSEKIDVRLLNVSQPLEPIPSQVWNFDQRLSLGELLLGFLHYYAYVFIFESDAISIRLGRKMNRAQAMQNRSPFNSLSQWHCICIEEPFTLSNAAHSVYDERIFQEIKKTFADSYHELDKHRDLDRFLGDFPSSSSSSPSPPSTPVPTTIQIANAACSNFVAAAIKTSAVVTAPDGCLIVGDDDDDDGRRKNIL